MAIAVNCILPLAGSYMCMYRLLQSCAAALEATYALEVVVKRRRRGISAVQRALK